MARYLLVQVDDNDRAEKLRIKLDAVDGIKTVGLFGKPTKFCECLKRAPDSRKGKALGFWLCTACGRPKSGAMQMPYNLLNDEHTPVQFFNMFLHTREPFRIPTPEVIARVRANTEDTRKKLERHRRRRVRAAQRTAQGR